MNKDNSRVPFVILSCFLIAFIVQGALKMCGVFIFEKALDWEIFNVIDSGVWLQIIYYSIVVLIIMYCLSFSLTLKPYSKKWYHYVLIICGAFGVTILKYFVSLPMQMQFVYDIILYILIPFIINLTTNQNERLFKKLNFNSIILCIVIHISLYFCYLGLTYWSNLLFSLFPIYQTIIGSASMFLTRFEVYIALFAILFIPKSKLIVKGE